MTKSEKIKSLATRTVIEVGAAGLGLAVAGAPGAIAAAAVKPVLDLIAVRENRGMRNAERLVEAAAEAVNLSPDELSSWAEKKEGRLMLLTSAIRAGYNTLNEEKVNALVLVLRNNLGSDDKLEIGSLIVSALDDLEAPHIKVLAAMINANPVKLNDDPMDPGVWSRTQLRAHLPSLSEGLGPIMAALERQGLMFGGGIAATEPGTGKSDPVWSVTDFGYLCFNYLEQRV